MPLYTHYCKKCDQAFDELMTFAEFDLSPKVKCPKCSRIASREFDVPSVGNARTVGRLLEQNAERNPEQAKRQQRKKKPRPWYRNSDKPLDLSQIRDVKKFVETGEKS